MRATLPADIKSKAVLIQTFPDGQNRSLPPHVKDSAPSEPARSQQKSEKVFRALPNTAVREELEEKKRLKAQLEAQLKLINNSISVLSGIQGEPTHEHLLSQVVGRKKPNATPERRRDLIRGLGTMSTHE